MKTYGNKLQILAFTMGFLFCSNLVRAQEAKTNEVFITTDGSMITDLSGNLSFPPEVLQAALKAPECRPADQDPAGNWGEVTEGFQLSVRFPTNHYSPGDSVVATVILRNVSTNFLQYTREFASGKFFNTTVVGPDGSIQGRTDFHEPPTIEERLSHVIIDPKPCIVRPQTQVKWDIKISAFYNLSEPGKRTLQVQQSIRSAQGHTNTFVKSGRAAFEISRSAK